MDLVNRAAVIVRGKQPFLDWINRTDPENPVPLDAVRSEPSVYLLPTDLDLAEVSDLVNEYGEELFEEELAQWYDDEKLWPTDRSPERFLEWFDVERGGATFDGASDEQFHVTGPDPEAVLSQCAWCGKPFKDERERAVIPLHLDEEMPEPGTAVCVMLPLEEGFAGWAVLGLVPEGQAHGNGETGAGPNAVVAACRETCAPAVRKALAGLGLDVKA